MVDTINQKIDAIILKYGIDGYYPLFREKRSGKKSIMAGDYSNLVLWQDEYCCGIDGFQKNKTLMERADLTVMEIKRILSNLDVEAKPERRKEFFERLIFLAIYKRNFLLAEEMVKRLLKEFPFAEKYENAWKEIKFLVESIKKELRNRKERDIIWIWLDAVSYMDRYEIPYLMEYSEGEHTVSFTQAYTMTPNTNPTLALILTGRRRIDESSYLIEEIDRSNSEVIALLEDTGHICKFVGSHWKQIGNSHKSGASHYIFAPCSEMLWDMVCNLAEAENRAFIVVHIFPELHTPYISMDQRQSSDCTKKRRIWGRREVNKQLRYFMDFIGSEAVQILFSDHGDNWQSKNVFHTILEIRNKNYKKNKIDEIFSYAAFPKLLRQIILNQNIDKKELVSEYAELQEIPLYNKNLISTMIKNQWGLYSNQIWGYRGIIDHKYMYLCHKGLDGKTDETLIENDSEKYDNFCNLFFPGYCPVINEDAVSYYREIVMKEEKQCVDEEKLKYSRYLQKVAQNAMPMHEKKLQILLRLFNELPKHGVAFRGGGLDTGRILFFYRQELKGVEYIIDNNNNCLCAELGIPIISPKEVCQKSINTIILASKKFEDEFRREMQAYSSYIDIIDVYQYLLDNGIAEKLSFYYFQPQSKDYDVGFPFEEVK